MTKGALILTGLALTALAVNATAWLMTRAHKVTTEVQVAAQHSSAERSGTGQRVQVQVEQITIGPRGFAPAEITRPAGPVGVVVVNTSGVQELRLQLSREAGGRLREAHLPGGRREWREYVDLPPGRYVITEANHPAWLCRLNITAR